MQENKTLGAGGGKKKPRPLLPGYFAEWSGGFFRRGFLKGTKVGIAGQNKHTSTYNSTGRVKKGNTTQLYGEGDPEGRFCRSPGWRMEEGCQGGPSPL